MARPKRREIEVIFPDRFSDIETLVRRLKDREGVMVDFTDVPPHIAQRMLDFLSGATFALNGTINKIKYKTYLLIPRGVTVRSVRVK